MRGKKQISAHIAHLGAIFYTRMRYRKLYNLFGAFEMVYCRFFFWLKIIYSPTFVFFESQKKIIRGQPQKEDAHKNIRVIDETEGI